jgi:geranylgeranyl diphosphate synthase, type I
VFTDLAKRYFSALDTEMRNTVQLAPEAQGFGVMLRYPLGWVDQNDNPHNQPAGKRIRPLLLLLCTEAVGGDWNNALPAAAAVELLHNFTLLHDDIQDESPIRHGRPTVWQVWGKANAINAGDALFTLAYVALQRLETRGVAPQTLIAIWRIFNQTMLDLTRGQHMDMHFEKQTTVEINDYITMITGKSASLIATCTQIGALVGAGDEKQAALFAEFGLNLGIAFQIHDDILGIWGDPSVTGKSVATDILARKKSLPVLYGLERSAELNAVYQRPTFTETDVDEAVALLNQVGAQEYTRKLEQQYFDKAMNALASAKPVGTAGEGLRALADWLFQRAH